MVFGVFDLFHPGHKNFLEQAKTKGNFLIAVIARDRTVLENKKRKPVQSEKERQAAVKKSGLVDKAVLGNLKNKYTIIKKYKPDAICLGYDQTFFVEKLRPELFKMGLKKAKIIRLKPYLPQVFKSSKIRAKYENNR